MKINKGELEEAKKYCKRLITITKDNNLKDNIYNILNVAILYDNVKGVVYVE